MKVFAQCSVQIKQQEEMDSAEPSVSSPEFTDFSPVEEISTGLTATGSSAKMATLESALCKPSSARDVVTQDEDSEQCHTFKSLNGNLKRKSCVSAKQEKIQIIHPCSQELDC